MSIQLGGRLDAWQGEDPHWGGTATVFIDGEPADRLPVFYVSYVQPGKDNALHPPMPPRDRAPHRVDLGPAEKIVPQQWKITMTSDQGDYELIGSVSGEDGAGGGSGGGMVVQ